jgi:hypothetical protein
MTGNAKGWNAYEEISARRVFPPAGVGLLSAKMEKLKKGGRKI